MILLLALSGFLAFSALVTALLAAREYERADQIETWRHVTRCSRLYDQDRELA